MSRELPATWGTEGVAPNGDPLPHAFCAAPVACRCECSYCRAERRNIAPTHESEVLTIENGGGG